MNTTGNDGTDLTLINNDYLDTLTEDPARWREFVELVVRNYYHLTDRPKPVWVSQHDALWLEMASIVAATGLVIEQFTLSHYFPTAVKDAIRAHERLDTSTTVVVAYGTLVKASKTAIVGNRPRVVRPTSSSLNLELGDPDNARKMATAVLHAMLNWNLCENHFGYDGGELYFLDHQVG